MAEAGTDIMRRSVHLFLKHYQYFTMNSAYLAFPFSFSVLLAQAWIPNFLPLLPIIHARVRAIIDAAGFPPFSDFLSFVSLKLSQTISSSAVTSLFTLSFLLLAKASVIRHLNGAQKPTFSLYRPLLFTQLCSYFLVISANATSFSILFMGFTALQGLNLMSSPIWALLLTALGAVFYSVLLANTLVTCNLASVIAVISTEDPEEKAAGGGLMAVIKAFVLIRGRASTALALTVPVNLGFAAIEVLFQYRIVRPYYQDDQRTLASIAMEGILIVYLYSVLIVVGVIIDYVFYRGCEEAAAREVVMEEFYASDVEKLKAIENFV